MTGIIDAGGGLRGIYGAGVFDRCLDEKIIFDCCVGVSAGSANIITYAGGQRCRTYKFYHDYSFRKEYMGLSNLFKSGSYISLEYIYGVLSNSDGENPLDFEKAVRYPGILNFTATDFDSGEPVFFSINDMSADDYGVLKASSCIPLICRPISFNGKKYFDGGVSDPLPFRRLLDLGCDKIVVVLSRPVNSEKSGTLEKKAALLLNYFGKNVADAVSFGPVKYNSSLRELKKMEAEGKCLIVAPDDCCGVSTITKSKTGLSGLYYKGYHDAEKIIDFIEP